MSQWLKQSTAITVKLGPFLDDTDGKTAETGLTISQADVRLSKNGGDFAQKNDANSATHDENGFYDISLNTTDTNTLGRLLVAVSKSGALPVWMEYMVVPTNVWDSMFGADYLQVDAVQVEGGDATDAINAACDTALADIHLDHLLAADYDPASKPGVATALLNELIESDNGVSRFTANALEQAPTGGSGSGDWTSGEKEQIRYRLQIDGTQTAPAADAPLQMPVSADAISKDINAADNLEAMLDGTGGTEFKPGKVTIYASSGSGLNISGDDGAINIDGSILFGGDIYSDQFLEAIAKRVLLQEFWPPGFFGENTVGERLQRIPNAAPGGNGGLPTVDANNYVAGIQGIKNQLDDLNDVSAAQVNEEVDTALADVNLDHLVGTATGIPAVPAGTFLDQIMDDGTATYDRTTDSLQAIRDNQASAGLTAQQVRDAMKLAPSAGEPATGSVDAHLDVIEIDARNAADNIGTAISIDGGTPTLAGMLTKMADDNGGADFDATTASLNEIAQSGGGGLTAQQVRDAMKLAPTAGDPSAGSVDEHLDTILAALTESIPEMSAGEPPITPTIKQALMYLYMALRNASSSIKTGDNTGIRQVKNDAGITIAQANVSDDGTTFTQGKLGAP